MLRIRFNNVSQVSRFDRHAFREKLLMRQHRWHRWQTEIRRQRSIDRRIDESDQERYATRIV